MAKLILQIKRVVYGKEDTPEDLREYTIVGERYPVGTLAEWQEHAREIGYDEIEVVD